MDSPSRSALARYHGDQAATGAMLDRAVDVRSAEPPSWLVDRLENTLVARVDPSLTEPEAMLTAVGVPKQLCTEMLASSSGAGFEAVDVTAGEVVR